LLLSFLGVNEECRKEDVPPFGPLHLVQLCKHVVEDLACLERSIEAGGSRPGRSDFFQREDIDLREVDVLRQVLRLLRRRLTWAAEQSEIPGADGGGFLRRLWACRRPQSDAARGKQAPERKNGG